MNNEYIIINKTTLEKRIEELENCPVYDSKEESMIDDEIRNLKQILSQSTPLIPEIEKAYDAGKLDEELSKTFDNPKGRYFNSLNLDI